MHLNRALSAKVEGVDDAKPPVNELISEIQGSLIPTISGIHRGSISRRHRLLSDFVKLREGAKDSDPERAVVA